MPGIKSLRHLVSGAKARTVDAETGTDLDLVYLTPRLIIMAWPGSGVEVLYRNNRRHVRRFLDTKHGEHYRIFNLVPRTENTCECESSCVRPAPAHSITDEADEFDGRVSRYPFPDHHPPPLSMIPLFVADMTAWLGEDERNVGVVHCKGECARAGVR
jgi:phosphatidylinositol-3,4,5-trisphosphate 3-phosphatase/dual-specificity protein phosphatase PTEN